VIVDASRQINMTDHSAVILSKEETLVKFSHTTNPIKKVKEE